ncbi:MAG: hypothetical protein ACK5MR_16840 [Cumulibacter sp.]
MTNTGADRMGAGTSDTAEVSDILIRLDAVENALDRAIKTSKVKMFVKRKNGSMKIGDDPIRDDVTRQVVNDLDIISIVEDPHMDGQNLQISDRVLNANE